jgi:hypothetical protein
VAVKGGKERLKELMSGKTCTHSEKNPRKCPELLKELEANVTKYGLDLCKQAFSIAPSFIIQDRDAILRDFNYSHKKQL